MNRIPEVDPQPASNLNVGLLVRLEANPGKGDELTSFLKSALPLVMAEQGTIRWYAVRFSDVQFGIFDVNPNDEARDVHHHGRVAAAIQRLAKNGKILRGPPTVEKHEVVAAKA